jgi:hypothetical protein
MYILVDSDGGYNRMIAELKNTVADLTERLEKLARFL